MKLNIVTVNGTILNLDNVLYVDPPIHSKIIVYFNDSSNISLYDDGAVAFYNWYRSQCGMQFETKLTTNTVTDKDIHDLRF